MEDADYYEFCAKWFEEYKAAGKYMWEPKVPGEIVKTKRIRHKTYYHIMWRGTDKCHWYTVNGMDEFKEQMERFCLEPGKDRKNIIFKSDGEGNVVMEIKVVDCGYDRPKKKKKKAKPPPPSPLPPKANTNGPKFPIDRWWNGLRDQAGRADYRALYKPKMSISKALDPNFVPEPKDPSWKKKTSWLPWT